jgi:quinol monooxygenase YgiN
MANRVMTVLEGKVASERWAEFEGRFAQLSAQQPAQFVQGFLVQSQADPTIWRVVAIWHSQQALEEYRASVQAPGGVLLFRSVGVEAAMSTFEVKGEAGGRQGG